MNANAIEILHTALTLPEDARAELAASLIGSLEGSSDADAQTAWASEVERRLAEIDAGTVKMVSWNEGRQVIAGVHE